MDHIVHHTPLRTSATLDQRTEKNVYFKMENQQKTGAFKFRGASYKLMRLTQDQLGCGVITASAGNHAQGLALAAHKLGVKATIYMAESTPEAKVQATRGYGANVVLIGESFQEAYEAALEHQKKCGATFVHPFDDYDIMAGQGTIALEMLEQESRIDTIIVPIGGGGLISGIAVAAKSLNSDIKVIGVQAASAAAMHTAYHQGVVEKLDKVSTIAEGIAVKQPGEKTLPIIQHYVDDVVTVSEAEIANAMVTMLERGKTLVEGAGAAALAGLLSHNDQIDSRHCGVIVSGGNFDIGKIAHVQSLANQLKPEKSNKALVL